jgi:predicted nucleic acid-binding protein
VTPRFSKHCLSESKVFKQALSESWEKSMELVKDIDEFDAPFIALSLELKSPLWTGDKKLINGLKQKEFDLILGTDIISKIRDKK